MSQPELPRTLSMSARVDIRDLATVALAFKQMGLETNNRNAILSQALRYASLKLSQELGFERFLFSSEALNYLKTSGVAPNLKLTKIVGKENWKLQTKREEKTAEELDERARELRNLIQTEGE